MDDFLRHKSSLFSIYQTAIFIKHKGQTQFEKDLDP